MNELALFAGAGLGLLTSRLLGHRIICYIERDPYCVEVLTKSLKQESEMAISTMPRSGTTCEPLTAAPGAEWWIKSLRVSRASHSQPAVSGAAEMMIETPGQTPFALLERSSPDGYFWRIPQSCFPLFARKGYQRTLVQFSETWPKAGMWGSGDAYPLPPLERHTKESGFGLLPTPVQRDGRSFYVVTTKTALDRIEAIETGEKTGTQIHWMQYSVVWHNLRKGWARPQFAELMMELPIGWTDLAQLDRDKYRLWLKQLGR
jgi:hypothetical protein